MVDVKCGECAGVGNCMCQIVTGTNHSVRGSLDSSIVYKVTEKVKKKRAKDTYKRSFHYRGPIDQIQ